MKKKYVLLIFIFCLLLLLPFFVQMVFDFCNEKRFLCFDIFKDTFFTPFSREIKISNSTDSLEFKWKIARESMAKGEDKIESIDPVIDALNTLQSHVFSVNTYAKLDSNENDYKLLKNADSLLNQLIDEDEVFIKVDSILKIVISNFGNFSLSRVFLNIKHYGIWTSKYLRDFENKVENENALVLAVRPKYQFIEWFLFNQPGEKVVLGKKNNWIFYRQDVDFLVEPSPLDFRSYKLDNPIKTILKFKKRLKEKGIELLVVVTPGKPSIYPEYLTGKSILNNTNHGKFILDSLTNLGINTVDLFTPFLNEKKNDDKFGALYLNDDTHWTPRGAEFAAKIIAFKVREMVKNGLVDLSLDSIDYVVQDSLVGRMGDIGEMSGLNKFNIFSEQKVNAHVVYKQDILKRVVTQNDSNNIANDSTINDTLLIPYKDDFRNAKILILGDSFSRIYQTDAPMNAGWIAHFAKELKSPLASIVSDGGASTLVREKLSRKPEVLKGKKLLIWEFVERDLRFGADGWKDIDF